MGTQFLESEHGIRSFSANRLSNSMITFMVVDPFGSMLDEWDSRINFDEFSELPVPYAGPFFTFPINPTDLIRTQAVRSELTASVTFDADYNPNAVVQTWGAGIPQWTLRGHTGFRARNVNPFGSNDSEYSYIDGYLAHLALYRFFECYMKQNVLRLQDTPPKPSYQLVFINWSDKFQDWWYVEPTKLPDKIRTNDKPLYYFYDIHLIGVKPYVSSDRVVDDISILIGNPMERLSKLQNSLEAQLAAMDELTLENAPFKIRQTFSNIRSKIEQMVHENMLFQNIQKAVRYANEVLVTINSAKRDINESVRTVLSPLYAISYLYKQVTCIMKTLVKLPIDLVSSTVDSIKQLLASLKGSGCGTTLIADPSRIGFNSLRS